jgi:hypothetical protein
MNSLNETKSIAPQRSFKPVLLSLLTLFSGILIGAGATFISMQRNMPKKPEPGPEYFSQRMMRHLIDELQLTEEQRGIIQPVINRHFETIDKYRQEARPKISEEIKQMNEAIMAVLTEPQKQIWQDRIKRMREVFPREGFGPGRGPGGRWRGSEGDNRRPQSEEEHDRPRPWRDDPNRPGRGDWRRPQPSTLTIPSEDPNSPPAAF